MVARVLLKPFFHCCHCSIVPVSCLFSGFTKQEVWHSNLTWTHYSTPIGCMYGIFTHIYLHLGNFYWKLGKNTIHRSCEIVFLWQTWHALHWFTVTYWLSVTLILVILRVIFFPPANNQPLKARLPTAPTQPVSLNGGMAMPSWYDIQGLGDRADEPCHGTSPENSCKECNQTRP